MALEFALEKKLGINFTFEYIYISINNYYGATLGTLQSKLLQN